MMDEDSFGTGTNDHCSERAGFSVRDLGFDEMPSQKQNGPFYVPTDPIRIFKVESKSEIKQDPYAFMILKGQE